MKYSGLLIFLLGCAYSTPPKREWPHILSGASFEAMSPVLRVAKRPLYQERGGLLVPQKNIAAYMNRLEAALENSLRKPGVQISRIGSDITVVMVRSSIIYTDSPEISETGADLLGRLARVLENFDMTWIEITGYTDAMASQSNAVALSKDMAHRVAVYLARHGTEPMRMYLNGRGSANPIADQSGVGRLMNLRVEVRLSAAN